MNTLAAGFALAWHGIDGWLYFLAAVSFLLAILATFTGWRHVSGRAVLFIAAGLLLWVLANILTGG